MVVDLEIEKQENWGLRDQIQKVCQYLCYNKKELSGNFIIRETNMKGFRIVLENVDQGNNFLLENNVPKNVKVEDLKTRKHSESRYASIFFVDWPIEKMTNLPK